MKQQIANVMTLMILLTTLMGCDTDKIVEIGAKKEHVAKEKIQTTLETQNIDPFFRSIINKNGSLGADELWFAFTESSIRTESKQAFTGKKFHVDGKIYSTKNSLFSTPKLLLSVQGGMPCGVVCIFPKGNFFQVFKLTAGQYVTISGTCLGKKNGNIVMTDCQVVSVNKDENDKYKY